MFKLVQDDDGHWYVIRAGEEDEFDAWVDDSWIFCEESSYEGKDFSENQIEGPHTLYFEDWKEEIS